MRRKELVREAPFALRVVQRKEGKAAIVYRRRADAEGRDRLQRVAAISPLGFTAGTTLLRDAIARSHETLLESLDETGNETPDKPRKLQVGPFHPLDADWGARVACYALIAAGLRDGERLMLAANHMQHADPDQMAWWLGLLTREDNVRALRALRLLTEAVQ